MDKFKKFFFDTKLQPHIFSLMIVVMILTVLSIVIYSKVKRQRANKAPEGILIFAEQYVMGVSDLYQNVTEGKLKRPEPYIFTLLSMLLVSNLLSLTGLESPTTSYSFTLTLGLIAWIGIYVVGFMFHKLAFLKRYKNPLEIISQFAPLISISFRIFGNIIGGSTIMYLLYAVTGWIWGMIPVVGEINLLAPIIAPVFHIYFDIFSGLIQAFVFSLLTMVYWSIETETEESQEEETIKVQEFRERKAQGKAELLGKGA